MRIIISIFNFLHLIDDQGTLSITSIACYVCLYKLYAAPQAGLAEVGAVLVSMASHQTKRYIEGLNGKEG